MDLIDMEEDTIDAEVLDSLAVSMDNFRVSCFHIENRQPFCRLRNGSTSCIVVCDGSDQPVCSEGDGRGDTQHHLGGHWRTRECQKGTAGARASTTTWS